jgi:ribokinase
VLMQLEVPLEVIEAVCATVRSDALVVLNPAPAATLPTPVTKRLDILIPNEHELALLGGADALLTSGVRRLLVTEGARGARLVHTTRDVEHIEPWRVSPVDTTAAGDAFCGAFAAWLARGATWREAADAAAAAGALATTRPGAIASLPSATEVAARMAAGRLTTEA